MTNLDIDITFLEVFEACNDLARLALVVGRRGLDEAAEELTESFHCLYEASFDL